MKYYYQENLSLLYLKKDITSLVLLNQIGLKTINAFLGFLLFIIMDLSALATKAQALQNSPSSSALLAVGKISNMSGQIIAIRKGGEDKILMNGDDIFIGDMIKTSKNGKGKITFADSTLFALEPNTDFTIDDFIYNGMNKTGKIKVNVEGGFLFLSGLIAKTNPNDMMVHSGNITVGIRGTIVSGRARPSDPNDICRFTLLDGAIDVQPADNMNYVLKQSYESLIISPNLRGGKNIVQVTQNESEIVKQNIDGFSVLDKEDIALIINAIQQNIINNPMDSLGMPRSKSQLKDLLEINLK